MNFVASSPQAKEAKMFGYTFSVLVSDDIFGEAHKVITVDAENIPQAQNKALAQPGVLSVGTLLGSIDRQPQTFLAW
jgi:hypothetical protein